MSILAFLIIVIVACVVLSALMLGLVFVSETTRDLSPFFQAAAAIIIVLCSVMGLRHAKWAMDHHAIVLPSYSWQYGWMYPGQAMLAFGGTAIFGLLGLVDAVRKLKR